MTLLNGLVTSKIYSSYCDANPNELACSSGKYQLNCPFTCTPPHHQKQDIRMLLETKALACLKEGSLTTERQQQSTPCETGHTHLYLCV